MTLRIGPRLSLPNRSTSAPTTTTDGEWRALRWAQNFTISRNFYSRISETLAYAAYAAHGNIKTETNWKNGEIGCLRVPFRKREEWENSIASHNYSGNERSMFVGCRGNRPASETLQKWRDNSWPFHRATLIFSIVESITVEINGVIEARRVLMVSLPLCRVNN